MRKEIEIKVKVDGFVSFREKLVNLGCVFSPLVTQDDVVFVNYDGDYNRFPEGANYIRIRKAKDKSFLTLKRGAEMAGIERETEISNPDQVKDMLEFMGYHEVVRVIKKRIKTTYADYEICLDEVEGLGSFVELERISDEDPETIQYEMLDFLKGQGLDVKARVLSGYDTLMYNKINGS